MPMPTGGAWPPPRIAPAYRAYRDWDAWYGGGPEDLIRVYQGRAADGGQTLPPSQRTYPGQRAGGVVGKVSRWLWGAPVPQTTMDSRLHVPLASDLAATAAGLLLSEKPAITTEDKSAQKRIEQMAEAGLITALRHAAEAGSAMGDVYLRPVIDEEVSPTAAITSAVHADGAIPTIRWGHLIEVTFWSELASDRSVLYRLLEHHDVAGKVGRITYRLFKGTGDDLGRPAPYADQLDQLGWLMDLVVAGKVNENGIQLTGLDRLDVVRVPNAGPQRRWRKTPSLRYLGRSDLDGNEPIFDRVDVVWTSWMRDIHLGRGRLSVPAYMLETQGVGQGAYFDADREVYSTLNAMPNQIGAGLGITNSQFEIRHVEHKATLDALVEVAMRHSGLSSQTLGEEGDVAMTATEAQSRERLSYITRGDRIASWGPAIADYVELHMAVERIAGMGSVDPVRPNVEFSDGAAESPQQTAQTAQLLRAADLLSIETGIRMVHPDWDDPQVMAEVQRIRDDKSSLVDPERLLGDLAGTRPPGDQDDDAGGGDPTEE